MAEKVKEAKPVSYNCKLEPIEAFVLAQLLDEASVKGSNARAIANLRDKLQKLLDGHWTKTGEFVGYQAPPGTVPLDQAGASGNGV